MKYCRSWRNEIFHLVLVCVCYFWCIYFCCECKGTMKLMLQFANILIGVVRPNQKITCYVVRWGSSSHDESHQKFLCSKLWSRNNMLTVTRSDDKLFSDAPPHFTSRPLTIRQEFPPHDQLACYLKILSSVQAQSNPTTQGFRYI